MMVVSRATPRSCMVWMLWMLVLLACWPAAARANDELASFAVVIGNNQPDRDDLGALRYADDDAIALHSLLQDAQIESSLFVRMDPESQRMHPELQGEAPPRWEAIETALRRIEARIASARRAGRPTELWIFYSGHGDVARGEGYVTLEDRRLTRTRLRRDILDASSADRKHVIVDACKSYFLAFGRGPGGEREPYSSAFITRAVPGDRLDTGFILSTSSDRESHEWARFQSGVFSYELRSALRGAADVDGDAAISYAELAAYLETANAGIVNPRFRPDYTVRAPGPRASLEAALLRWRRDPDLHVDVDLGHLYLETAHGIRLLDLHPARGQRLQLYLPAERPIFLRSRDEGREYFLSDRRQRLSRLSAREPTVRRRGALHLAFERLFDHPFGITQLRDFVREPPPEVATHRAATSEPARTRRRWRITSGVSALAFAGLGVGSLIAALGINSRLEGASQRDIAAARPTVIGLNALSLTSYAVAAVAGTMWLVLKIRSRRASRPRSQRAPWTQFVNGLSVRF